MNYKYYVIYFIEKREYFRAMSGSAIITNPDPLQAKQYSNIHAAVTRKREFGEQGGEGESIIRTIKVNVTVRDGVK